MVRPLRIEYPGAWYHVACRGNQRLKIFGDDKDRTRFLKAPKESRGVITDSFQVAGSTAGFD